ncbi:uncharacterized protein RAG0_11271 [Rhynchosporium agropyri]|uniref:Uncharacterized protein n=1 Tax=Rhynchosporium agropyri TaxID=914238 RepID=A0A1E1L3C8_9HELO|nr:uncharacterized protein RAG0_11271 [Rhynchosporium agropyri]
MSSTQASQPDPKSPTATPATNNDDQSQDVNMDAPDSPPENTHAAAAPSSTLANTAGRVNGDGGRPSSGGGSSSTKTPGFGAPGSIWTTKKFSEEYEKAEANMLDRAWENKYGDPLLDIQQQQ